MHDAIVWEAVQWKINKKNIRWWQWNRSLSIWENEKRLYMSMKLDTYLLRICDDFEWRSIVTDGIMLYSASSYHQLHRFHKERPFIYTTRGEKEEKIGITGRIIIRENRYMDVVTLYIWGKKPNVIVDYSCNDPKTCETIPGQKIRD
jgi:hypothetical protein